MEQWLTPPLMISLAALGLSALNSYRSGKKDNKQEFENRFESLEKAIEQLEKRVAEAEANAKVIALQVGLFWKTIEQQMAPRFMAPKSRDE
jgi:hypothetical protein